MYRTLQLLTQLPYIYSLLLQAFCVKVMIKDYSKKNVRSVSPWAIYLNVLIWVNFSTRIPHLFCTLFVQIMSPIRFLLWCDSWLDFKDYCAHQFFLCHNFFWKSFLSLAMLSDGFMFVIADDWWLCWIASNNWLWH